MLDKLPKRLQAEARWLLAAMAYAETREDAERQKRLFQDPGFGLWGSCLSSKETDPRAPVRTLDRTPDLPTCGKNRRS